MSNSLINRRQVIEELRKYQMYTRNDILNNSKNLSHTETLNKLKNFGIISKSDYSRSCGDQDFTDFYFKKASSHLNKNSKYNIVRPDPNGGNLYLTASSLPDILSELKERYVLKESSSFDSINGRIKGYFIEENILRFGNKRDGYFSIYFEPANLNTLLKKDFYYLPSMSHIEIQGQLANLGHLLGYSAKVARGEKNIDLNGTNMSEIATVSSLDLDDFIDSISFKKVDYIDVLWFDNLTIAVGFEIELSGNWSGVVDRFIHLCSISRRYDQNVHCIVVSYSRYEGLLRNIFSSEAYATSLRNGIIKFLPLENLIDFLININHHSFKGRNNFFGSLINLKELN